MYEIGGQGGEVAVGHVEDQGGVGGAVGAQAAGPVGHEGELASGVVSGGKDEFGGGAAVGERGLQGGGDGEGGGDAVDDLEGDAGLAEGGDLLVGAAEDEGVAGFEAEDGGSGVAVAGAGVLEHEGVDAWPG